MSRAQSLFVTSLLVSSGVGTAAAQPLDARSVRPAVMLLVDTSGSMERLPDDGSTSACTDYVDDSALPCSMRSNPHITPARDLRASTESDLISAAARMPDSIAPFM